MAQTLRLFVSATRDLEAERAIVGQILADLPVQVGAEIRRTPLEGLNYDSLFEQIGNVDRVYFLLGRDITAPSGAEWHLALKLERRLYPLRLASSRTLAAREFLNAVPVEWTTFRNPDHLARLIGLDLIDLLLHPENRYGLNITELEALKSKRDAIERGMVAARKEAGGAEGGGVLLDSGRTEPIEGVALDG